MFLLVLKPSTPAAAGLWMVYRIDYDVCTVRSYVGTLNKRVIYSYVLYYSSTLELESTHYVNTVGGMPQTFLRCLVVCVCYQAATRHGWSVPKAPILQEQLVYRV